MSRRCRFVAVCTSVGSMSRLVCRCSRCMEARCVEVHMCRYWGYRYQIFFLHIQLHCCGRPLFYIIYFFYFVLSRQNKTQSYTLILWLSIGKLLFLLILSFLVFSLLYYLETIIMFVTRCETRVRRLRPVRAGRTECADKYMTVLGEWWNKTYHFDSILGLGG